MDASLLRALFHLDVPVLEKIIRPILVYLFLIVGLRLAELDRLIEGDAVVLIENGQLRKDCLKQELITVAELEEAAHKQGFESLDSIDRAVLEPGGSFSFFKKQPPLDDTRHQELLRRLDALTQDVAKLRRT